MRQAKNSLHPELEKLLTQSQCVETMSPDNKNWQDFLLQLNEYFFSSTHDSMPNIDLRYLNEAQRIANIGSWGVDHRSNKVRWSDQTYIILGYAPQSFEPSYKIFLDSVHPDDKQDLIDFHKQALQGRRLYTIDYRLLTQDNKIKYVQEHSENIYDTNGVPLSSSGTLQDLSEQKQREELFRRGQKMQALGNLAGGIAHDFNNLLGVMVGYAELLTLGDPSQDEIKLYTENILTAGERGAKLARRMLSFSQHQPAEIRSININNVIREEQQILQKSLTARIQLELHLADNIWQTELDTDDLKDAILNISINAMHAMPDNGKLIISSQNLSIQDIPSDKVGIVPGDYVQLSMKDNGTGMDQSTQSQLFDPFFTTKGDKGTGLGMSQVYGFIKRCNGAIDVFSEPGKGTEIVFYLPRHKTASTEQNNNNSHSATTIMNARILIVDDEAALCNLINQILKNQNYITRMAYSAEQALEILKTESYDLLLSDVVMPGMNGYELAEEVYRLYPEMKIQILSGYSDAENIHSPFSQKLAQQRLHKPVKNKDLLQAVSRLLSETN